MVRTKRCGKGAEQTGPNAAAKDRAANTGGAGPSFTSDNVVHRGGGRRDVSDDTPSLSREYPRQGIHFETRAP
jgi:hypothetical protein